MLDKFRTNKFAEWWHGCYYPLMGVMFHPTAKFISVSLSAGRWVQLKGHEFKKAFVFKSRNSCMWGGIAPIGQINAPA
jgi:hypothetical protein